MQRNGSADTIHVASLEALKAKGVMVVKGAECPIAVFAHEDNVAAVDNRCPHLGFPLHKGTVQDGILTCHWHHARFDLCSGCTFDPFADDVPAFAVEVRDGQVYVAPTPLRAPSREYYLRRLRDGMARNIGLIQAKSILGLLKSGIGHREIVREIALFGARFQDGWSPGMFLLANLANLLPNLEEERVYLALYQAARQVAADCAGNPPRRDVSPLDSDDISLPTLKRWLRYWTEVRHRDGAERTLLTAIHNGATPAQLGDLLFAACTDRFYSDGGHVLDGVNKAFELLDLIGWEHAAAVLPAIVPRLTAGRGGEELNAWRHPIDLVPPIREAEAALPALFEQGKGNTWNDVPGLAERILGEDPLAVLAAVQDAAGAGATPDQLGQALCYAAAMRVARFSTSNEISDWFTALHTLTFCNAVHQALRRCPTADVARGVLHGAMSIYLDRFLNVPPARLPGEREKLNGAPVDGPELLHQYLDLLDQRHEVDASARTAAIYMEHNLPIEPLFDTLSHAVLREDLDFHTVQMVESGIRQFGGWAQGDERRNIVVAIARYLAAHSPTMRARLQTAQIALRLHRGDTLYEDEEVAEPV